MGSYGYVPAKITFFPVPETAFFETVSLAVAMTESGRFMTFLVTLHHIGRVTVTVLEMSFPTISQYADTLCRPNGLFRTLGEPVCERNAYGEPVFVAGGNGAVFKVHALGSTLALKCYTRGGKPTREIADYFAAHPSPLVHAVRYMPEEIYVYGIDGRGRWYDVVVSDWTDEPTLALEIRRVLHYRDGVRAAELARGFMALAVGVLSSEWAHGDIKPANITVAADGSMRLLDLDAAFIPRLAGLPALERGTAPYNHPLRGFGQFDSHIDDYPIAMLAGALRTVAADCDAAAACGDDMTYYRPDDGYGRTPQAYACAVEMAAERGDAITYRLLRMLLSPVPEIAGLEKVVSFALHGAGEPVADGAVPEPFVRDGAWGYMAGGVEVVPPLYDSALSFSEGLAAVQLGGCWHYIDTAGRTAVVCGRCSGARPFRDGVAAIRREGRWHSVVAGCRRCEIE